MFAGTDSSHASRSDRALVAALALALLAFNSTIHLVPSYTALYVPLNLLAAAVLLVVARRAGLGLDDLGLQRDRVAAGCRLGALAALAVVAGLVIAVAAPALHPLLEDERVGGIGVGLLAYRTLIRIPLGTALFEELAFRGVLFAAWRRTAGTRRAVIASSAVFGLWHIRPTLELLSANDVAQSVAAQLGAVGGAVVVTALGGVLFCWLRLRSDSLFAPLVTHAIVNSSALAAAFVVLN